MYLFEVGVLNIMIISLIKPSSLDGEINPQFRKFLNADITLQIN